MNRPSVVVVLPAYNAARTLERTVAEIPDGVADALLLVDDASHDETVQIAERLGIPTRVHTANRGYGANQKTCYSIALEMGADIIVMLHPDYQYDPALLPDLVEPIREGRADVVLASRMGDGGARAGGMPWWKRLGNRVLTALQNRLLGTDLSELHTGYRAYSRAALERSGFLGFVDGFVFDAQMLVAFVYRRLRISEISCPARYLPEASSVGFAASVRYGLGCIAVSIRYRLHHWGLFPSGWLKAGEAEPMPEGVPPAVRDLLLIGFIAWRGLVVDWLPPIQNYDTMSYFASPSQVISFTGDAPRAWPIPLFYWLLGNDTSIVIIQAALGIAAWVSLATYVASAIRHRSVAIGALIAVLSLGLSVQAMSWDRLLMPESLGITASVAFVTAYLAFARRATRRAAAIVGILGGLLALLRPVTAPFLTLLGAAWAMRRRSDRVATGLLALPILVGVLWLAFILPRQGAAYGAFERQVRGASSADYASDTWASVLWWRHLRDPDLVAWLDDAGAPLDASPVLLGGADKLEWGSFRASYGASERWQEWFEGRGQFALTIGPLVAEPLAHARAFIADSSLIFGSPWGRPNFSEYGPPARAPWVSEVWFPRSGPMSLLDLSVLACLGCSLAVAARRRVLAVQHPLLGLGILLTLVSLALTALAWLLVGVELVRHTVPGPLGLRLGLILTSVAALDLLVARKSSGTEVGDSWK